MNRQHFLRSALAFVAGSVFVPRISAQSQPVRSTADSAQSTTLYETYVAGVQYQEWYCNETFRPLPVGTTLSMVREPNNPEDHRAVALYTNHGTMVGYVPRWLNHIPANLIDGGNDLFCTVSKFNEHEAEAPWHLIKVRIQLRTVRASAGNSAVHLRAQRS